MIEIELVELLVEFLELAVHRVLQQVPVELLLIIPLVKLTDFSAHEGEFLAGMRHDIRHKGSESRELLPVIAGHLLKQGGLAVNHFIVGQRKHEMLREGIHQREGQKVMVV